MRNSSKVRAGVAVVIYSGFELGEVIFFREQGAGKRQEARGNRKKNCLPRTYEKRYSFYVY
ncbi:hypothetical protein [Moorena sp. SIO3B2]|uniref:hypothetical protein n=1 Tax=Moorena sp. SIO3B2 TaxID=2607827 RepID=UPI0013CB8DCE|nr:hypothetical protein [Moorena sp. SIO3B2]NEP37303.1 hypothetical protein [Moorena sp. SIO3B2]